MQAPASAACGVVPAAGSRYRTSTAEIWPAATPLSTGFDLGHTNPFHPPRTGSHRQGISMMAPYFPYGKRIHPMQAFRIVVIGAGQTGTPLLQQLLDAPFVQLLGVADLDLNQPGIALARARGVPVTTRFMELVDAAVDIIIAVTGALQVRESLRSRSEEHTSELQSQSNLVCRLLLEKKKESQGNVP